MYSKENIPNFSRNRSGLLQRVALGVQNLQYLWNGWRWSQSYYQFQMPKI